MRRYLPVWLLSALALLLLAANLLLARPKKEPTFFVDGTQVLRIEEYFFQDGTRWSDHPQPRDTPAYQYTDPAGIRAVCELYSHMFLREYPYERLDDEQKHWAQCETNGTMYRFYMADGTVRELIEGSNFVYFDGYWCYASAGEDEGYQPLFFPLSKLREQYRERVESGMPRRK